MEYDEKAAQRNDTAGGDGMWCNHTPIETII